MKPKPKDPTLYKLAKQQIYKKYPKHSAYRSGLLVKKYKELYKKKYNSNVAYTGQKSKGNLTRWYKEDWKNQRGGTGYKKKGDVYRPTKRINSKTPATFKELSKKQIEKAKKEKKKTGRVKKFKK